MTVNLVDKAVTPEIICTASLAKYTPTVNVQQVLDSFWVGFNREAQITKNVTLKHNDGNCDYEIALSKIQIVESSRNDTIKNSASAFNNKVVELNTVEIKVEMTYKNLKKPNLTSTFSDSRNKSEKLTNNRNMDQMINGQNKDHRVYRTKPIMDHVFSELSERLGHRIWVPLTRNISRSFR